MKTAKAQSFPGVGCSYEINKSVLERIWFERLNQRDLLKAGKIPFDCASPIVDANRKLRVLVEEVGEVAEALDLLEPAVVAVEIKKRKAHLRDELTQVAAVAIAWLESMEEPQS
jgi:hypothetical protein